MNQNAFFELVTKVLSGEATPDEIKLFDSYMLDDEYRDLYEWLKKEWDKDVEHPVKKFEYAQGLEKLQTKIKNAEQTQRSATVLRMPMQKRFLYVAASVALLLTFAFLAKTLLLSDNIKKQVHFQSYQTQRGERNIARRKGQINLLKQVFNKLLSQTPEKNMMIAGDLNATADSEEIAMLLDDRELINSFIDPLELSILTHPSDSPSRRLDYILVNDNMHAEMINNSVQAQSFFSSDTMRIISDHLPVVGVFSKSPHPLILSSSHLLII